MKIRNKNTFKKIWSWFDDHTSTCMVVFSYVLVTAFVVTNIVLATLEITLPDTLIEAVFAFFGTELISLALIKMNKKRNDSKILISKSPLSDFYEDEEDADEDLQEE